MLVTGYAIHFEQATRARGYTMEEVEPCIVSRDGDQITADNSHPAYPHPRESQPIPEPSGPGTELKKLLSWFGITATGECACNSKAGKMDDLGTQWVLDNIDTVTSWLEEEARARGGFTWLSFTKTGAKSLILLACRKAERQK